MEEIWKDIPWYEWKYQASNLGNMRSLDRIIHRNNWTKLPKKWKILKYWLNENWYCLVNLWRGNTKKVHRIICLTFLNNYNSNLGVNHKDWNKLNNNIENLEMVTHRENMRHSFDVLHSGSKKIIQYDLNWNFMKEWKSWKIAWEKLNILSTGICNCCKWKSKTSWWFIFKYKIWVI